ncbi:MAG: fucose isomerase [Ruminococcaceae bacterium]|nr:fucose isomerase [Oscillospiraceae bacterium]
MLKGIKKCISPELLYVLDKMGHGDEIVISDGNFPGESIGKDNIVIRSDGTGVPELLSAVLELMPLDTYADPVYLMDKTPSDKDLEIPIWDEYKAILKDHTAEEPKFLERQEFYDRAKKAYAIVVTGEGAIYANILLKKGVVK